MPKDNRIRFHIRLAPEDAERVERLRAAAGLGAAKPVEGAFLAELVRRGAADVEREHGLDRKAA